MCKIIADCVSRYRYHVVLTVYYTKILNISQCECNNGAFVVMPFIAPFSYEDNLLRWLFISSYNLMYV